MVKIKLYQLCAFTCIMLLMVACAPEPTAEPVAIVTGTFTNSPTPVSLPTPTAVLPTPLPIIAHSPAPATKAGISATAEPTPESTIDLGNITPIAQWGRGNVYKVAYSSDGRSLIVMAATGTYIHDLQDPNTQSQRFDSDLPVLLSPNGETAVIGQEVRQLNGDALFSIPVDALQAKFFLNGELLAVKQWIAGEGAAIQLWDVYDGQLIFTFEHTQDISFSPDGNLVLTTGQFEPFRIYEWPGIVERSNFKPEVDEGGLAKAVPVTAAISQHGKHFALGWEGYESWYIKENVVEIRSLETNEVLITIPPIEAWGYKEDITFSCDEPPFMIEGPGAPRPVYIEFSPNDALIAVTYNDNFSRSDKDKSLVNIYRLADGELVHSFPDANHIAFSPDEQTMTVSTVLGDVQVWSLSDFSLLHEIQGYTGPVRRIQFSPDGQTVAVEYFDKTRLQKLTNGIMVAEYPDGKIAFSPDRETLAVGYGDGQIEWRQLADNSILHAFSGHTARVNDLVFLPSGDLVSVADDCTMYAWNPANGTQRHKFEDYLELSLIGEGKEVRIIVEKLLALPSGNMIAGSSGLDVSFWAIDNGKLLETRRLESWSGMMVTPGGDQIALLSQEVSPLTLWEIQNEEISSHLAGATSMSLIPGGNLLVVGTDELFLDTALNGSIRFWDAVQNVELTRLPSFDKRKATAVQFSPDGRYLLVGSTGGLVTVWEMPTQ